MKTNNWQTRNEKTKRTINMKNRIYSQLYIKLYLTAIILTFKRKQK